MRRRTMAGRAASPPISLLCRLSLLASFLLWNLSRITAGASVQIVAPNRKNGRLEVMEENIRELERIPAPVAVVSVVGAVHSGKSYFMNRLLNKGDAFKVGYTVQPETTGLWLWTDPVRYDGTNIVLIDSEGFFAPNVQEEYDAKIFSMATLLSSEVIHNTVKIIDQQALEYLELLARRANLFGIRAYAQAKTLDLVQKDGSSPPSLSTSSVAAALAPPSLAWIVQDFVQDLQGYTPLEWLWELMGNPKTARYIDEVTSGGEGKPVSTPVSASLASFFRDVDCLTLPPPAGDVSLLQKLDRADTRSLHGQYLDEIESFRERMLKRVAQNPKRRGPENDQLMDGRDLANLLRFLIDAGDAGGFPSVPPIWQTFATLQLKLAQKDLLALYNKAMTVDEEGTVPLLEDEVYHLHARSAEEVRGLIATHVTGQSEHEQSVFQEELEQEISVSYARIQTNCCRRIENLCRNISQKSLDSVEQRLQGYLTSSRSVFVPEIKTHMQPLFAGVNLSEIAMLGRIPRPVAPAAWRSFKTSFLEREKQSILRSVDLVMDATSLLPSPNLVKTLSPQMPMLPAGQPKPFHTSPCCHPAISFFSQRLANLISESDDRNSERTLHLFKTLALAHALNVAKDFLIPASYFLEGHEDHSRNRKIRDVVASLGISKETFDKVYATEWAALQTSFEQKQAQAILSWASEIGTELAQHDDYQIENQKFEETLQRIGMALDIFWREVCAAAADAKIQQWTLRLPVNVRKRLSLPALEEQLHEVCQEELNHALRSFDEVHCAANSPLGRQKREEIKARLMAEIEALDRMNVDAIKELSRQPLDALKGELRMKAKNFYFWHTFASAAIADAQRVLFSTAEKKEMELSPSLARKVAISFVSTDLVTPEVASSLASSSFVHAFRRLYGGRVESDVNQSRGVYERTPMKIIEKNFFRVLVGGIALALSILSLVRRAEQIIQKRTVATTVSMLLPVGLASSVLLGNALFRFLCFLCFSILELTRVVLLAVSSLFFINLAATSSVVWFIALVGSLYCFSVPLLLLLLGHPQLLECIPGFPALTSRWWALTQRNAASPKKRASPKKTTPLRQNLGGWRDSDDDDGFIFSPLRNTTFRRRL